jgi:hypothetical protein
LCRRAGDVCGRDRESDDGDAYAESDIAFPRTESDLDRFPIPKSVADNDRVANT